MLLAHDANQATCEALISKLEHLSGATAATIDTTVAGSVQDAAELLRASIAGERLCDVAFLCLDLLPAPTAAAKLADFAIQHGIPVVLVTRSLRWLPSASHLHQLPWVTPEADFDAIKAAVAEAVESHTTTIANEDEPEAGDRVSLGF